MSRNLREDQSPFNLIQLVRLLPLSLPFYFMSSSMNDLLRFFHLSRRSVRKTGVKLLQKDDTLSCDDFFTRYAQ